MIETKEIELVGYQNGDRYERDRYNQSHGYADDLTAFGWQKTEETTRRSGRTNHNYQILARETSMPNYNEYRKLENDYEAAKSKIKYYDSMEATTVLLLLVLFILPGVLYIAYKSSQKSDIEANNKKCKELMQKAVSEARSIK